MDVAGLAGRMNSLAAAGGIGGLLAVQDAGASQDYVYFHDALGSVGQVLDLAAATAGAAMVAKYEYDPYGNQTNVAGAYDQPFRFSGKYHDAETGLGYWGYRYYNPVLGRWINRDPIAEDGGINLYIYVRNASPNLFDSLGLRWEGEAVYFGLCWPYILLGACTCTDMLLASTEEPMTPVFGDGGLTTPCHARAPSPELPRGHLCAQLSTAAAQGVGSSTLGILTLAPVPRAFSRGVGATVRAGAESAGSDTLGRASGASGSPALPPYEAGTRASAPATHASAMGALGQVAPLPLSSPDLDSLDPGKMYSKMVAQAITDCMAAACAATRASGGSSAAQTYALASCIETQMEAMLYFPGKVYCFCW